jgi:hypothetical protein
MLKAQRCSKMLKDAQRCSKMLKDAQRFVGRHGHQFRRKKLSCGVVKSLYEASIQKARNEPSTQLIEATSWVEGSNTMIKAKEHS